MRDCELDRLAEKLLAPYCGSIGTLIVNDDVALDRLLDDMMERPHGRPMKAEREQWKKVRALRLVKTNPNA